MSNQCVFLRERMIKVSLLRKYGIVKCVSIKIVIQEGFDVFAFLFVDCFNLFFRKRGQV